MNKLIDFSIKNKLAIWLFTIAIIVSGLYTGLNMKMESMPNINVPVVSVVTIYPGADPQKVDDDVTTSIVQKVMGLSGVEDVQSNSSSNVSMVIATYDYDADLDNAVAEIKEKISKLDLPDTVQAPNVAKINMNDFPIYTASISNKDMTLAELTTFLNEKIIPVYQGVEGVISVNISGQQYEEIELEFDEEKLTQYGLDKETVKQMISATNVEIPLGLYVLDNSEVSVVVDGDIKNIKDFMSINILNQVKPDLKLSDIATYVVKEKKDSIARTNGSDSISISIIKAQDANTVEVVNNINKEIENLLAEHDSLNIAVTSEQASAIEDSVFTMLEKAVLGALFAVIVIYVFLKSFKSTIISIISIPLSLVIAILIINSLDITLNIMTLGAMTVAIGRVIDDSIVVIENIYRRMGLKEKLSKKQLIISATKEVFVPIASSTAVTIAVFLPLGLVNGPIGEMFLPFALTMVFALLASLLVSVTIVPMLAHSMFKEDEAHVHDEEKEKGKLAKTYSKFLNWCLNRKLISSLVAIFLLIGSLALAPVVGFSFIPSEVSPTLTLTYETATGESREGSEKAALDAEKILLKMDEVDVVEFSIGAASAMTLGATSDDATFNVIFEDDISESKKEKAIEKIEKELDKLDFNGTWTVGFADMSAMSSSGLSLSIYGDNYDDIRDAATKLELSLKDYKELSNIETSLSTPYTEYRFIVDNELANKKGLTAAQIGMSIANFSNNEAVTKVKVNDKEIDLFFAEEGKVEYDKLTDIMNSELKTPFGSTVKFKEVIQLEKGTSPDNVSKLNNILYATFTADINGKDIAKATNYVMDAIDELEVEQGILFDFGGVSEQMTEAFTQLGLAIVAAIVIVYIILVLTFGSGAAPFAILFSLPFVIIGSIFGLFVTGLTISATGLIGVLMLVGIVVTNAIVLVDRIINKQDEGLPIREAILEAAQTRLRPILMTAIATVCALLPLAISGSNASLISQDLAVTVIGGLISSTLLTLIFVPLVYEIVGKKRKKVEE